MQADRKGVRAQRLTFTFVSVDEGCSWSANVVVGGGVVAVGVSVVVVVAGPRLIMASVHCNQLAAAPRLCVYSTAHRHDRVASSATINENKQGSSVGRSPELIKIPTRECCILSSLEAIAATCSDQGHDACPIPRLHYSINPMNPKMPVRHGPLQAIHLCAPLCALSLSHTHKHTHSLSLPSSLRLVGPEQVGAVVDGPLHFVLSERPHAHIYSPRTRSC